MTMVALAVPPIAGHDRGNALDHEARTVGDHVGRGRAKLGPERVHR
jgi:hypothetical protein